MKIMVGYDGTDSARQALQLAADHAVAFKGSVHVVTSMTRGTEKQKKLIKATEERLQEVQAFIEGKNVPCETHLLIRGLSTGEDLVHYAEENNIDEIVVGIKKKSKVGKLLLGSTAQYVILESKCPVVTITP